MSISFLYRPRLTATQRQAIDTRRKFSQDISAAARTLCPQPEQEAVPAPVQAPATETDLMSVKRDFAREFSTPTKLFPRHPTGTGAGQKVLVEDICRAVAHKYNLDPHNLRYGGRKSGIVRPRQVAMYLCHVLTKWSYGEIGRRIGGHDHTTVMHAIRKIKWLIGERDGQPPRCFSSEEWSAHPIDQQLLDDITDLRHQLQAA